MDKRSRYPTQVYLLFDERMTLHKPLITTEDLDNDENSFQVPFENSSRITSLYKRMMELEKRLMRQRDPRYLYYLNPYLNNRFIPLQPEPCPRATIELVHSAQHYDRIRSTEKLSDNELRALTVDHELYFCRDTFLAATLACGGVVQCVDAVMNAHDTGAGPTRAIALVRPPGHHATRDEAMGFCYFNNIAVAAKHSIHTGQADRVFILDFDIHHGNGIQDVLFDCPNIFYLSIHRGSFEEDATENDYFYPGTGRPNETGTGRGAGSNLNIVWPRGGMGNTEYAAAFTEVVLPVLSAFKPDLILIACGLDAAKGDLLGDCGLSPDMYFIMIKSLLETAGVDIPMVAALEGGYNLEVIGKCMEAVALAMFDEPWEDEVRLDSQGRVITTSFSSSNCDLSRYWDHQDFEGKRKLRKTTKNAIAAIKQSAKALGNRGMCLGSMQFDSKSNLKPVGCFTGNADYRFGGAGDSYLVYPRNHRPYQKPEKVVAATATLPFKKRKCYVEMEVASALVALNEK